ncbi:hypothetical protein [uncultured Thiodictyon sp.]|uniref:nSTAND1 domain-containing NTPase n=1 Tax=uncultured Thiodictyon sp. TaxID=1846217 RepID=UPI0025D2F668|nr:hypothetical protein [uncultured Thiodictyon sp.]
MLRTDSLRSLAVGQGWGLVLGLAWGLGAGVQAGLGIGIGMMIGCFFAYYRVLFYLIESFLVLFRLDLCHNPYLWDWAVVLPIWRARRRLTDQAAKDPETGAAFIMFLLENRPLQRRLAAELLHPVLAGLWAQRPLDHLALTSPPTVQDQPRFSPSDTWLRSLADLRAQLETALHETQISFRRVAFADFAARLDAFRAQTLLESQDWARHYLAALDRWRSEAVKELTRIEDQARLVEPIAPNVYRPGSPLRPGQDADLFLGREDLRRELSREVLTARELPLLLIQGQRRVGKTSLLNFLPTLLGAGFRVVFQDMQGAAVTSVPAWLKDLRRRVAETLQLKPEDWDPPDDWVAAWAELEPWLTAAAEGAHCRLILAFDEYETLHRYLAQDPDQGRRLLGAIRSFSQHQTQVCLLFAGATPFSELRHPDWSEFFVQALRLRVDYLGREDSLRLITEPVPSLRYPLEVPERLFDLTRGHPALLQILCKHLVDIANRDGRRAMTMADLDEALVRGVDRESPAMERFWNEFCVVPGCRACVEDVLAGRPPANRAALTRLAEHGYIIEADGRWRLRVPLFEDWLRRYREGFDGMSSGV